MKRLVLFLLLLFPVALMAQDTLPKFTLKNAGNNRIIIGWTNTFQTVKQISIQRSFDSLTGFKTILTVADPTSPQNGYVDAKATNDHMFYRLYIMLDKGVFMFSDAKKPVLDTSRSATEPLTRIDKFPGADTVTNTINPVVSKSRPPGFLPSLYVYTFKDGNVRINLPDDEKAKKYSIKFFEDNENFLFELKDIRERTFKLDKANFYHAGWFRFELYEDGKLIEKHKFYLDKDF